MYAPRSRAPVPAKVHGRIFFFCRIDETEKGARLAAQVRCLQDESRYRIDAFNYFHWQGVPKFEPSWDWMDCDGIVLHDSLALDVEALRGLTAEMPEDLAKFSGLKLLMCPPVDEGREDLLSSARDSGFELIPSELGADQIDEVIGGLLARHCHGPRTLPGRVAKHHVLQLCSHAPGRDPRLSWVAEYAPPDICIHTIGCAADSGNPFSEVVESPDKGGLVVCVNQNSFTARSVCWEALMDDTTTAAASLWSRLAAIGRVRHPSSEALAAPSVVDSRDLDFAWLCAHFDVCAAALLDAASRCERVDALIATDPDSLLPACILKVLLKVPLIYDSHEFWSESFPRFSAWERDFWRGLERRLIAECDAVFTVSEPLAEHMSEVFGVPFVSVPNCEPFLPTSEEEPEPGLNTSSETLFLYMGNYAEDRGLEKLVRLWALTPTHAILHMRGHKTGLFSKLETLARESGLLDRRIFFLDPVPEVEMVHAAREAHVGIIPYEAIGPNNTFCCPNKLSQYCTAGLAILANRLVFVEKCVERAQNGAVADINDPAQFAAAVARLCEDHDSLLAMKRNSRRFHEQTFHWQEAGKPLYAALEKLLEGRGDGLVAAQLFRTVRTMPAMGRWRTREDGSVTAEKPTPLEESNEYIKKLNEHIKELLGWIERKDEKYARLKGEHGLLKDELRKCKKQKVPPPSRQPLMKRLITKLLGKSGEKKQ